MRTMTTGASPEPDQLEATGFPYALMLTHPARPDDPVVYVNAAFTTLTGYEADEALGRSCHFLPSAGRADAVMAALRDGGTLEASIVTIRADGERSVGHARVVPVEPVGGKADAPAGAPESAPESGRDEPGAELLELRHRVKNHLSLVLAMLRLHAAEGEGGDVLNAAAGRIEAIARLYEQELEGSIGTGGAPSARSVDLGSYLGRVTTALAGLSPAVGVQLQAAPSLSMSGKDAAPLGLIVSELVTNAFRHAYQPGEGGEVRVALDGGDERLRLTVADDGCGMARTGPPEGLGGTIIQALTQQLGGTLRYAGGPDGVGTQVTIDLPRRAPASS